MYTNMFKLFMLSKTCILANAPLDVNESVSEVVSDHEGEYYSSNKSSDDESSSSETESENRKDSTAVHAKDILSVCFEININNCIYIIKPTNSKESE